MKTWTLTPGLPQEKCRVFLSIYSRKIYFLHQHEKQYSSLNQGTKIFHFDPPIMDKKIWSSMPRAAKDQDKNLRRVVYKVSSAVRPIDNTLRMVYASKPESTEGETYKTWLQLEQTVLNTRALVLDALSFTNELHQEQALKATISPSYQRPVGKEEVFGEDLNETIKNENEANKLLNDAAWQRKRAAQNSYTRNNITTLNFKMSPKSSYSSYSRNKSKNEYGQGKSQNSGNNLQGDQATRQSQH